MKGWFGMNRIAIARIAGAASLALGLAMTMSVPAQAHVGTDATGHGTCTDNSSVKLKVKGHHDELRVTAQVKSHQADETWAWVISDNAVPVAQGDEDTNKKGDFTVRESIPNQEGNDTVNFTAVDSITGETCTAEVTFKH